MGTNYFDLRRRQSEGQGPDTSAVDSRQGDEWQTRAQQGFGAMQGMSDWDALQEALRARAAGQGQSPAEQQMRAGLAQGQAQVGAQIGSARGLGGSGMAQRFAQGQGAQMGAETGQQIQMLRAGEQAQAEQQLGQIQMQKDQMMQQYMAMGMSAAEADRQAQLRLEEQKAGWKSIEDRMKSNKVDLLTGMGGSILSAIGGGLGGLSKSDRRAKKEVKRVRPEEHEAFFSALAGAKTAKKDGETSGELTSTMAAALSYLNEKVGA